MEANTPGELFDCAALLVCLVIVTLFFAELARINLSDAIAAQFICAMTLMIGGPPVRGQRVDQPDTPEHRRDLRH